MRWFAHWVQMSTTNSEYTVPPKLPTCWVLKQNGGGVGVKGIGVNNHSFWKVLLLMHDLILSISICCGNQISGQGQNLKVKKKSTPQ